MLAGDRQIWSDDGGPGRRGRQSVRIRPMALPEELIETALRAADAAARELLMRADRPSSGVITKSTDTDMVSDADRAAEVAILEVLDAERPRDGRLAEEGGARAGTSGLWWVIDPLDGTTNYLWGIPH